MNVKYWVTTATFSFSAALLALPVSAQTAFAQVPQLYGYPQTSGELVKTASASPAGRKAKSKARSGRRLSKATLSALKPQNGQLAPPGSARPADGSLAAAMGQDTSSGLREPTPVSAVVTDTSTTSLNIDVKPTGLLSSEEPAPVAASATANQAGTEAQAAASSSEVDLGQESVSVIDRFSNKPKAKQITNGPLRLRMHDKALRASVQIPLTGN